MNFLKKTMIATLKTIQFAALLIVFSPLLPAIGLIFLVATFDRPHKSLAV